ncbi:MAG TPA: type II secretion system F family protein [Acidimicrobiales bacterium]|nr:type II secretion system F family protein [Acidimicrobiales bacterium]
MILATGCAGLFALGLGLVFRALRPARAPLAVRLAALEGRPRHEGADGTVLGRVLADLLDPHASRSDRLASELAIADMTMPVLLARQAGTGLLGAALMAAMGVVMTAGGVPVPPILVVVGAVVVAAGGGLLPGYLLRAQAGERRAGMRHVLAGYLDLTGVILAAGEGLETALRHAASMGSGWAYDRLAACLEEARLTRRPAWEALGALGVRIGVAQLADLGESLALAGVEGARLRDSLAARARSLREHELAEIEARAGSATEGMSGPLVFLLVGFVVLIGYPALMGVVGGLGP